MLPKEARGRVPLSITEVPGWREHSWDSESQSFTLHSTQLHTGTHRDVQFPFSRHGLACLFHVSAEAAVSGGSSAYFTLLFLFHCMLIRSQRDNRSKLRPVFSIHFFQFCL
ncbi:hypothetical protein XENOCAPTIV_009328 [Xenoophorus captivus]|uniref:Uncharacterized protein n=1 Tax=Xenoophorus captivus TaxID=1517983 RepID=A0ABV0QV51_9TELE